MGALRKNIEVISNVATQHRVHRTSAGILQSTASQHETVFFALWVTPL